MTDRERTLKWLECCGEYNDELEHIGCTSECPYWENENCCNSSKPFQDALLLLKEQETIEPIDLGLSADFITWGCPICKRWLDNDYKYCPYCGKAVKWR